MKIFNFIVLAFAFCFSSFGQTSEPEILILTPNEFKFDKIFEQDLQLIDSTLLSKSNNTFNEEFIKSNMFKKMPLNSQKEFLSIISFTNNLNFSKTASITARKKLIEDFEYFFPNHLILLSNIKSSGSLSELKNIADSSKMQYIINIHKIELIKKDSVSLTKIFFQFYDNSTQTVLINSEYSGDWFNNNKKIDCVNKSLECTIHNSLSKALKEVFCSVILNNPTKKRERELDELRKDKLQTDYPKFKNDKNFLKNIVTQSDTNIVLADQYQIVFDSESQSKFVAFFTEQFLSSDFNSFKGRQNDSYSTHLTIKNENDSDSLDYTPQTFSNIVKGVKFKNKWYYEKSKATYVNATDIDDWQQSYFLNLIQWGFYKENTSEINPEFWETGLFSKVKDLKLDPDWEKYGTSRWKAEQLNNKPYIGFYEIVANELNKEQLNEIIKISNSIFIPFYKNSILKNPNKFAKYSLHQNNLILIFPEDKSLIINPIMITNGRGQDILRYFVTFPNEKSIYEWTYFSPQIINKNTRYYSEKVLEQIQTITDWNFSHKAMHDMGFLEKYVLEKTGTTYKYLIKKN